MKTTLATLTLFMMVLMCTSFPFDRKGSLPAGAAAKEKRVQYAAWDDVNVIAHGLLQLGQGLKEHVDKTKVQMRDISSKMKVFNRTVTELGKESKRLQVEGEALRLRAQGLEEREGQLLNVTAELREKAEEMQLERRAMSARMSRLEEKVDSMLQGGAAATLHELDAGGRNGSDAHHIQVRKGFPRVLASRKRLFVWRDEGGDTLSVQTRRVQSVIALPGLLHSRERSLCMFVFRAVSPEGRKSKPTQDKEEVGAGAGARG